MKKSLLLLSALLLVPAMSGCGDVFDNEPYYNVSYVFKTETHKYYVYVLKDEGKNAYHENQEDMYDAFVVPLSNYHYIALTYRPVVEVNGRNVELQNEFYKNTSTLYVYGKL